MSNEASELNTLRLLVRTHPEINESFEIIKVVMSKAKFPINSFYDFAASMGGCDATISLAGQMIKLQEAEKLIPAYYFPISNEHDLVAKVSDLTSRRPAFEKPTLTFGHDVVFLAATAVKPNDAGEPPRHLESLHVVKNAPGIAGNP